MTGTLSYSEVIAQKKAAEEAIAKILKELQEQTGANIHGIGTTKLIGAKEIEIEVSINLNY